jgi:hypothetical protein
MAKSGPAVQIGFELSTDMFPEDGCLWPNFRCARRRWRTGSWVWVYGVGEDGVTAFTPSPFTQDGIENLR